MTWTEADTANDMPLDTCDTTWYPAFMEHPSPVPNGMSQHLKAAAVSTPLCVGRKLGFI